MTKHIKHTLFIDSLLLSEVAGNNYIPTMLHYHNKDEKPRYGVDAEKYITTEEIVNQNFKVKLGDVIPGGSTLNRETFSTAIEKDLTAYELTKDFFENVLHNVVEKTTIINNDTGKLPIKIMVAEPLAFQVDGHDKGWIANYRANIKRILNRYEQVEFLPEPFAVYQFYRYGLRIPQLKDDSKHIALIIDFGGGTFDACVIESTLQGDISMSGKHSKPLASVSEPIGGFYINQVLAEYLIKRGLEGKDRKKSDSIIKTYQRILKGEFGLCKLNKEKQTFIKNFEKLKLDIEQYKIDLSYLIQDWNIDSNIDDYKKVKIKLPDNPFIEEEWSEHDFRAHEFKKIFKEQIWKRLSRIIKSVIGRSQDALDGKSITTTLISGGSSNIRWLSELLCKEFDDDLKYAKPLPLNSSFQEIVAKGLAIECARRNYDNESEFVSVTYNPIKLLLDPDSKGHEKKRYTSIENKIDMKNTNDGDLIPSAQSLIHFIDEPIQWKVKLSHAPKNHLKYYFIRPDTTTNELDCYNVGNNIVYTKDKSFDSQIRVELNIKEDGTVTPQFIYKMGNVDRNIPKNAVTGEPFVIDMTYESHQDLGVGRYIGFDFGTSNSSICELSNENIKRIENRSADTNWTDLQGTLSELPYPVSLSIRKFLAVNNDRDIGTVARDAFESVLAFAAYTAASEAMAYGLLENTLKSFAHRSLGPLKGLLEGCLKLLGNKATFSSKYSVLFTTHKEQFELAIKQFNAHKHDKLESEMFDAHSHLLMMANVCKSAMEGISFGFCNHVEPVPYKRGHYLGSFKVAHDSQPFINTFEYTGSINFRRDEALLYSDTDSTCLNLFPFIIWHEVKNYTNPYSCIFFDKKESNDASLKPCDSKEQLLASKISSELLDIYEQLVTNGLPNYSQIETILLKKS